MRGKKTCGQWKRQAKVRYNHWEIHAGKICKTNFMQSEARKEVPGLLSLLLKTEKKNIWTGIFRKVYASMGNMRNPCPVDFVSVISPSLMASDV